MAENVIIAGKRNNRTEIEMECIGKGKENRTFVFCKDPLTWIAARSKIVSEVREVHVVNEAFRFADLMKKVKIPTEYIVEMLRAYLEWEKRQKLNSLEYLVLSLIVERAISKDDFFTAMADTVKLSFKEFISDAKKESPEKAESVNKKNAEHIYEMMKIRLPELGFIPGAMDITTGTGGITLITAAYAPLCTLFLECLYRTEHGPMCVFLPEDVRMCSKNTLYRSKANGISTYISTPSIDFMAMYYQGTFHDFIEEYDRVVLCGEQMIRKKTAGFLARLCAPVETEYMVAREILSLRDGKARVIETHKRRKQLCG